MRKIRLFLSVSVFFLLTGLILVGAMGTASAGVQFPCDNGVPADYCQTTFGLADCFQCVDLGQSNFQCVPQDNLCDDGNDCTEDICEDAPPIGCQHFPATVTGFTDLPTECYICEPTANNLSINNGICDSGEGEDCQSDPEDCGIVGYACTFPNPPAPPLPAPGPAFDPNVTPTIVTQCEPLITLAGTFTFETIACEDGDRCTENICNLGPNSTPGNPGTCTNDPIDTCIPIADGCCPAGCIGPGFGNACPVGTTGTNCDPDCCPNQDCGDSLVEDAETCDDTLPSGEAGLQPPSNTPVDVDECRDPGTVNECTYCGDGIIDSPTEQCDGAALGDCITCSGNCVCGIIPPAAGLRIFGSGILSCSIQKDAAGTTATHGLGAALSLVLAAGAFGVLRRNAR